MYADQFKTHETREDRRRQRAILTRWTQSLGLRFEETGKFCRHDARVYNKRGTLVGFAEAKYCRVPKRKGYFVDVAKIYSLFARSEIANVYAFHVVSWEGDIGYLNVTRKWWTPTAAGVYDLQDPWDSKWITRRGRDEFPDEVYLIPVEAFKRVA